MSNANPIETAPKDGTRVIALSYKDGDLRWATKAFYRGDWWWADTEQQEASAPTHWLPIPEPTKSEA